MSADRLSTTGTYDPLDDVRAQFQKWAADGGLVRYMCADELLPAGESEDAATTRCEHDHPIAESLCALCEARHERDLAASREER